MLVLFLFPFVFLVIFLRLMARKIFGGFYFSNSFAFFLEEGCVRVDVDIGLMMWKAILFRFLTNISSGLATEG